MRRSYRARRPVNALIALFAVIGFVITTAPFVCCGGCYFFALSAPSPPVETAGDPPASPPTPRNAPPELAPPEFAPEFPPEALVIVGDVTRVTDGDTLVVVDAAKESYKIRLQGIDAPEKDQEFGAESRLALANLVLNKSVRVEWTERDKYGRTLGEIFVDDRWINIAMVEEGWAWHYKYYSDDEELAAAETRARAHRRGLWAGEQPAPPWEFRHGAAEPEANELLATSPESPPLAEELYWLNTKSDVRHNRNCREFGKTKEGHYCGATDGRRCRICGG